jgi:hypothetical protein
VIDKELIDKEMVRPTRDSLNVLVGVLNAALPVYEKCASILNNLGVLDQPHRSTDVREAQDARAHARASEDAVVYTNPY